MRTVASIDFSLESKYSIEYSIDFTNQYIVLYRSLCIDVIMVVCCALYLVTVVDPKANLSAKEASRLAIPVEK